MLFDKQAVLDHIEQQVGPAQAQQAAQALPDQVDHEQHGSLLQQFGVDPQNMANQLGGQQGGSYGDQGRQGGYGDQGQQGGYGDQGRQGGYGSQGDRDDQDERGGI